VINGDTLNEKLSNPNGFAALALKLGLSESRLLEHLYLSAYARYPSEAELAPLRKSLQESQASTPATATAAMRQEVRQKALEDLMWALLTSKEFLFNY